MQKPSTQTRAHRLRPRADRQRTTASRAGSRRRAPSRRPSAARSSPLASRGRSRRRARPHTPRNRASRGGAPCRRRAGATRRRRGAARRPRRHAVRAGVHHGHVDRIDGQRSRLDRDVELSSFAQITHGGEASCSQEYLSRMLLSATRAKPSLIARARASPTPSTPTRSEMLARMIFGRRPKRSIT